MGRPIYYIAELRRSQPADCTHYYSERSGALLGCLVDGDRRPHPRLVGKLRLRQRIKFRLFAVPTALEWAVRVNARAPHPSFLISEFAILSDTALKIIEILAQLFEREGECEDALHRVDWHVLRHALVAQRRQPGGVVVERRFDGVSRSRALVRHECGTASAQVIRRGIAATDESWSKTDLKCCRKRQSCGPPYHDQVMAQPEQWPQQRCEVRLRSQVRYPFARTLDRHRVQAGISSADLVLNAENGRFIEASRESPQQLGQGVSHEAEHATRSVDREVISARGQHDERDDQADNAS